MNIKKILLLVSILFSYVWALSSMQVIELNAEPWHPEIDHYPRLIYTSQMYAKIVSRLNKYPYSELYAHILARSASTPSYDHSQYFPAQEYNNAQIAKCCAFVAAVEQEQAMADKAIEILENLNDDVHDLPLQELASDVHIAEAVQGYCQAYDILRGHGFIDENSLCHTRLTSLSSDFYQFFAIDYRLIYQTMYNNHRTKSASAIGTSGITLNQHPEASHWVDFAMINLNDILMNDLSSPDGCYAEGGYYYQYSAVNHIPFIIALRNAIGDASGWYNRMIFDLFGNIEYVPEYIGDFITNPRLWHLEAFNIKVRMPDGNGPPIDDANLHWYPGASSDFIFNHGIFNWHWLNHQAGLQYVHCTDLAVDFICHYDCNLTALEPTWQPSLALKDGGKAVFRDSWAPGGLYFLLNAEHGNLREAGAMHEHPDNLSFIACRGDEMMAIDSGYIRWEEHDLVRHAKNHNTILINGTGPPSATYLSPADYDAYIEEFFTMDNLDYARASQERPRATINRLVLFPMHSYFSVVDFIESTDVQTYTWLLHGNGGGDSGGSFEMLEQGGRWTLNDSKMESFIDTTAGKPSMSHHEDWHGFVWGQAKKHQVTQADIDDDDIAALQFLFLGDLNHSSPTLTQLPVQPGNILYRLDNTTFTHYYHLQTKYGSASIDLNGTQVRHDGRMLFIGKKDPLWYFQHQASEILINDQRYYASDSVVSLYCNYDMNRVHLFASLPCAGSLVIYTAFEPESISGENVTSWEYLPGDFTSITLSGESEVEILLSERTHPPTPTPTATNPPTITPTPTCTGYQTSTPTLTATATPYPRLFILVAGYMDTEISSMHGGRLSMLAVVGGDEEVNHLQVELTYNGVGSGVYLMLADEQAGVFILPSISIQPGLPAEIFLLGLEATLITQPAVPATWPFLYCAEAL